MNGLTEYIVVFCAGISSLGVIIGAVVYTIKRELNPIIVRIESLEHAREEEVKQRLDFEGKLLGKLDAIKDSLGLIRESYVSEADLDKQQKLCPARMKAMEELKK